LPKTEQDRFEEMMCVYAAMIDCVDRSIGTLFAGLQSQGELENTLILFLSDNGGNAEGGPRGVTQGEGPIRGPQSHVLLGMNWATLCNTPFARYKYFTQEGGFSTPLVAHWPAGIYPTRNGTQEKQQGHHVDIMATCIDLAGAKYPIEFKGNKIEPLQRSAFGRRLMDYPSGAQSRFSGNTRAKRACEKDAGN
jgi:arylsulfatase